MSVQTSVSQMLENLAQSQAELMKMLDSADESAVQRLHGEEKWSISVMLAHLTEARAYFAAQIETFLKDDSVTVGRTLDNEQRVDAIINAQHTQFSREQLKQRLIQSYEAVTSALAHLTEAHLNASCTHARLGQITLGEFIQKNIVEHDQAHIEQAQGFLQS
jgi:hypothetical protein